jgi:hypothetical protein
MDLDKENGAILVSISIEFHQSNSIEIEYDIDQSILDMDGCEYYIIRNLMRYRNRMIYSEIANLK